MKRTLASAALRICASLRSTSRALPLLAVSICFLAGSVDAQPREMTFFDSANRFLDKDFPNAKLVPSTTVIDSFEDWAATKSCWSFQPDVVQAEPVLEHATDGKFSLKVTFLKPADGRCRLCYVEGTPGWGSAPPNLEQKASLAQRIIFNDEVRLDVFNPGGPVKLGITMGKDFVVELKPGANEVVLKISEMIPDVFRITGILPATAFYLVDAGDKEVALTFDNFRWVGPGVGKNLLKNAKMFDFGWEYYCRPYFRNVDSTTGYDRERGYGWETPNKVVFEYSFNIVTQCSSGRQPHDELLRDSVMQINTPFLVDLPDGRYRVHVVEGAVIGWYSLHASRYELTIVANGQPALVRHPARSVADALRAYYSLDQTDWEPGEDRFRKYFAPECCWPLEFDVDVKGGPLKLEFKTDPFDTAQVSFMLIYPVDKAPLIEPEIAALWRDVAHRFNDVSYGPATRRMAEEMHLPGLHEEYLVPDVHEKRAAALKPAPIDQASGYVLFNRDPMEEVYPDTVPAVEERGRAFAAFGARGDIQTFAPAIYALRSIEDASLSVGDFAGPGGIRIAKERGNVRVVNCIYRMTSQQSHGDWRYVVMPWYLVKREKVKVAAGTSRRWWVNVDVPADAAPGTYTATATISAKGSPPRTVALKLQVLPFALDPVPADVELAMYMGADTWYGVPFRPGWRYACSWRSSTPEGKAAINALLAEHAKAEEQYVKAEFDLLRKYGFNTVYYYRPNKDEITPEVTAGLTMRNPEEEKAAGGPVFKVESRKRAYLYEVRRFNEENVSEQRKAGYDVVLNWIGNWEDVNQEAGLQRFESGFLMWRLGAKGCIHNPWRCSWGNPYHPFDGHSGEWGSYCMPGSGPVPTLNSTMILEGAREGIQDYRWLVTLERLIKDKAGTPAAAEAERFLAGLRAKITPDARDYFQPVGGRAGGWGQTWSQKDTAWKGADYREARNRMAQIIAGLSTAK